MNNEIKCTECEDMFNEDYVMYTSDGDVICEGCEEGDLSQPKATILYSDGLYDSDIQKFYCYELMGCRDEHFEDYDLPQCVEEYHDELKWKNTGGYRGHYQGKTPEGYTKLKDTWFCGMDGHNMDELMSFIHECVENNQLWSKFANVELFIAFPLTSNVFSTGFELYVKDSDIGAFKGQLSYEIGDDLVYDKNNKLIEG